MISARGLRDCGVRPDAERRATSGSRNAYVLPEPVRPRPRTSRPASESASVAAWMGVGGSIPRPESTFTSPAGTPRSLNVAEVDDRSTDKRKITFLWRLTRTGRGPGIRAGVTVQQCTAAREERERSTSPVLRGETQRGTAHK